MENQKFNQNLCPNCQTGADALALDNKEPICPYIHLHNGQSCVKFKELQNNK
ncbi:MAG: hypothetical protein Q4A54_10845 [Parabacteroides sp.]|nr:hypothetical protein [Parabacteroides sp.]